MDALVLSCGGSVEPLIESISKYDPDLVYFLHSEQSFFHAMYVLSFFNYDLSYKCKLVKDYQNLNDVFVKSREIFTELNEKDYEIRVDFTGGTKTMSAGLVLASIGQDCKHSYIGSKDLNGRDKNGLGVVLSGHESITEQEDPYESFAIFEFERAKLFFNQYQFSAAKVNFEDAMKKSKSDDLKRIAKLYIDLVELYDLWDKFDIKKTKNIMLYKPFNKVLKQIREDAYVNNHFLKKYPYFVNQIEKNIKFLELKISQGKKITIDNVGYYLPDLLNNAQRRIEEGKYDDAVARLYRAIELIAQIKLTHKGLINEDILSQNKVFKIKKSEIDDLPPYLKNKIKSWYEYNKEPEKDVFKIGLFKNYL